MAEQTLEDAIDRLYKLPLAEFTTARNELARQSKDQRAAVGALQKPSLPAWAVNQLYWHRRAFYDATVEAAERARTAQTAVMSGRRADVAGAESAHGAAMKAAVQQIRHLLAEAGDPATPATMIAVNETLQALPSAEPPGRLTRPLKPMGLEALSRLLAPGGATAAATILPFAPKTRAAPAEASRPRDADLARRERAEAKRQAQAAKREAEARAREVAKLEAELREARAAERAAEQAASRARSAASAAEAEHRALIRRVDEVADEAVRLTKDAASKDRAVTDASVARQRLEARLKAIASEGQ